jgi:hypothetical protein
MMQYKHENQMKVNGVPVPEELRPILTQNGGMFIAAMVGIDM